MCIFDVQYSNKPHAVQAAWDRYLLHPAEKRTQKNLKKTANQFTLIFVRMNQFCQLSNNSCSIHKDGSGSGTVHRSDHSAGRTDDGNISIHGRICRRHHSSGSFSNRAGRITAVDNGNTWNARSFNHSSHEYGHSGHQKLHDTVEPGRGNRNHRDADNNADRNDNHRGRDQKRHDHVRGGGQNRRKPGSGSMQKHKQPSRA